MGAAVLGIALFGEPSNPARLFFLALLVLSIMGLMLTTPAAEPATRAPTEVVE